MTHSTKTISARKQTAKFGRFMISSALTAATLVAYSAQAHAEGPWTEWDNQNNFTHTSDGKNTTITTTASRSGGDSPDLDIDAHESVRVNQISSDALFYGRAADDADPTRILGSLSSNGRLLIIDRNGVFFGAGSNVDTAGLIATTGDISDDQIMNNEFGNYAIENLNGSGSIELNGQITIAEAGLAGFVAPTVKNNGVINAKLGKVVFASGEKVTLDLYGDKLVEIEVAGDGADALLENTGIISAEGGHIQLTAASAKQAVDNIINVKGVVTASSATRQGGKIVLGGGNTGTVKVAGKVDAKGTDGGFIEIGGENVHVAQGADIDASATDFGDGGEIKAIAQKDGYYEGNFTANGGILGGNGGFIETSGLDTLGVTEFASVSAAAYAGGIAGTWYLDPQDIIIRNGPDDVPNVNRRFISAATLSASLNGSATNVSLETTDPAGSLSAGDVFFDALVSWNSVADLKVTAINNVVFRNGGGVDSQGTGGFDAAAGNEFRMNAGNVGINTASGNVNIDAGTGVYINVGSINAATGDINVLGNGIFRQAANTSLDAANISITADVFTHVNNTSKINATNTVKINRATAGDVSIGTENGGLEINQGELDNITAATIVIGDSGATQNIGVDVVNAITGDVALHATGDVDFSGTNSFKNLDANAAQINVLDGSVSATNNLDFDAPNVSLNGQLNAATITGTATTVKVENSDAEIQDGIDVAASGATVNVGAGTYNEKLLVNKSLTLAGAGRSATTIDTSGLSGYGLQVTADDVNLRAFTLEDDATSTYGIKATGDNLELRNVRVRGFGRSEIDLNGVTGASLINVVADGMNTAGVGIALTNVTNATLTGVTTRNNNWGGVGLYDYSTGATSNIVFDAASAAQLQEDNPVYIDNAFGFGAHDIVLPGFEHAVRNAAFRPDGANFTFFQRTEQDAINYAVNLDGGGTTIGSSVETLGADGSNFVTYENNFVVGEDAFGTSMFINPAVQEADAGGTINVRAGTYEENVIIDKALDLNGSGRTLSIIKGTGAGNGINLTASDINMRDFAVDGFSNGIYTDSAINNIFMRNVNVSNNANYGIEIHNNAVVDGLDMRNVRLTGNGGYGLRARGSVNNLDMHGGLVSGSTNGIGAVKANGDGTYLTNVSIRDVTFTNNALKAIYMEKLSDAEFKNLDIRTSGTTGGSSAGIDINLKYGNYQDIVLDGTKIRDSATGATNNAITIKARNDGSYAANPASLTGLTITNSDIVTTGGYGVVVGNNVNNATLSNNTVDGAIAAGMLVYGGASDIEFDNNTVTNSKIGIVASGSSNVSVHDNDIATAEKGVYADNALNIKIFDNDVTGTTLNGIHVINSDGTGYNGSGNDVDIWGNTITSASGTGILVENSAYATIGDHPTNPYVTGFGGANNVSGGANGIVVKGSDNAYISYNIVHDVDQAGIKIENNSTGAKVLNNDIDSTGREGIISLSSDNVEIRGNDVNTVLSYVGIGSVFGNDVTIANNTVSNAKNSAIYTQNMGGTNLIDGNTVDNSSVGIYVSSTSDATVSNNKVGTLGGADNIRGNGITIRSSAGALVDKNVVTETKGAGIALHGSSTGVTVSNNDIDNVNREGIFADTDGAVIDTNDINGTGMQGISLSSADNAQVKNNTINATGSHGIMTLSSNGATIQSNTVDAVSGDGIHIEAGANTIVEYNKVGTTGRTNNIKGDGIYASGSNGIIIRGNEIAETHSTTNGKGNGIKVLNSDNAIIGGLLAWSNVITNAGWDGMSVVGGDSVMIESNIITDAQRAGIFTKDLTNSTLHYNYVNGTNQFRGIVVNNGTGVDLLANTVLHANLDGIFVKNGDKVTVDGNTTNFSGANGILVEGTDNVTLVGNKSFMSGNDGIQVNGFVTAAILNNTISFTTDDGIEVLDGVHVDIVGNIMGHIGHNAEDADGIRVSDVDHSVIKYNAIADVLDDGIRVIGGNYAGIFANHILLTGDDGIEVSGVYASGIPNEWQMLGDLDYPQGGYNVNIQDNEIVLTGDDGIEVGNSESVRINNNDILFAGVGEENVQIVVNAVADELDAILSGPPAPAAFALTVVAPEPADFSFTWGDGDGIEVYNIHRQGQMKPGVNKISAQASGVTTQVSNDSYSDWTVLIQGNDISWTGGDGIDVNNAGRTLIGGSAVDNIATPEIEATEGNTVYQAGISTMSVEGFTSFRDWVETGPFADHEARRDVWWDEDLTDALKGHLTTGLTSIGHDAHDGIIATNITNNGFGGQIGNAGNAGDKPSIGDGEKPSVYVPNYIGYALNIIGNTVSTTGDDGIEAGFSSSALISGNNIMGSGIGGYDGSGLMVDPNVRTSYGSSDEYGADGISVFDIYGENSFAAGSYTNGYEEYALVIDGNIINGTDDDGIEVDGAGRTLITRNNISEAGVGGGVIYGFNDDFFGSDGIHARGVFNNSLYNSPGTDGQNYYNYALNITGNTVDTTKDDGIDVLLSGSTVIGGNNISHAGYGKERDYNGGGILGADGINVTAVHADTFGRGPVIKNTLDDVPPGFVVDGDYREYSVVIEGNTIDTTGDDGIQVLLSGDTRIAHNTISNAGSESGAGIFGGDGINVLAFGVFGRNGEGYTNVELVDNTISNSLDNGVDIMGVNVELTADINTITNSGDNGIRLLNMEDGFGDIIFIGSPANNTSTGFNSTVTGNEVSGSTNSGLSVEGTGHNNVILAGNTFTNNAIGARFESGAVDISNLESPNTITNTNPLGLPVGLVFDGDPEDLTINGGTIGATSFNGFLNAGSFYVRFEDGSILDPVTGAPLLINGLNASYDGFTPPADGILTQARLDSLEARIYDADDAAINGRGQLFVGFVPESGSIENIEDFFNRYGAFAGANGNIQVTIARLPYIQQPTGGSQIFSAAGLNGIAPAAGGDDTTPEGLAGIEPAAGEEQGAEEVSCWGDAASNASGGQASSFSFGGSFGGDSITQAAGCNTASAL